MARKMASAWALAIRAARSDYLRRWAARIQFQFWIDPKLGLAGLIPEANIFPQNISEPKIHELFLVEAKRIRLGFY